MSDLKVDVRKTELILQRAASKTQELISALDESGTMKIEIWDS